jgi:hypothetical protein
MRRVYLHAVHKLYIERREHTLILKKVRLFIAATNTCFYFEDKLSL